MASRIGREEILDVATQLFSAAGYTGVSMRDIASACQLNVGSLYHHFNDKQELHFAATQHAFAGRSARLLAVLKSTEPPYQRLLNLIDMLCQLLAEDQTFLQLMQRELLDGDTQRLKQLAEEVFNQLTIEMNQLCSQLNPQLDPALSASTIIGMTLQLFQSAPLRQYLPGFRSEHQNPEVIATHIKQLISQGLISPHSRGSL